MRRPLGQQVRPGPAEQPISISLNALDPLVRLLGQDVEHDLRVPMLMFHARPDPGTEQVWIRCCLGTEPVARLVAVVAGRDHIRPMPPAVLLRQQVFARGLQARSLPKREAVCRSKAGTVGQPHREGAVEAAPRLGVEGGITGRFVAGRHMRILDGRGVFLPAAVYSPLGHLAPYLAYAGWNTDGFTDQQALYRAGSGAMSR